MKAPSAGAFSFRGVSGCLLTSRLYWGNLRGTKRGFGLSRGLRLRMPLTDVACRTHAARKTRPGFAWPTAAASTLKPSRREAAVGGGSTTTVARRSGWR
jgi:hypothetical protein